LVASESCGYRETHNRGASEMGSRLGPRLVDHQMVDNSYSIVQYCNSSVGMVPRGGGT
jgi:hypothetical protein